MSVAFIAALIVKHFVADFVLQTKFQYSNKGKFLHPGGLLHGLITIAATAVVLLAFRIPISLWPLILGVEFVAHYMMDFIKVRINQKMGWSPTTHQQYFILLGFDQMVHYLTYVWILMVVSSVL
jgi:hypothetical protein